MVRKEDELECLMLSVRCMLKELGQIVIEYAHREEHEFADGSDDWDPKSEWSKHILLSPPTSEISTDRKTATSFRAIGRYPFAISQESFTVVIRGGGANLRGGHLAGVTWFPNGEWAYICLNAFGDVRFSDVLKSDPIHLPYAVENLLWPAISMLDQITVTLRCDLIRKTISFIVNGHDFGIVPLVIDNLEECRPFVLLYENRSATIL